MDNNPEYIASLAMMPEAERNALLYGDWDSFAGQVFSSGGMIQIIIRQESGLMLLSRSIFLMAGLLGGAMILAMQSRFL